VTLLLVLAQLGDAATAMLLPPGAEMNPIRAMATPAEAFALKVLLVILLLATAEVCRGRLGQLVVGVGTALGVIGILSNLRAVV
jgi:hypothetical protein